MERKIEATDSVEVYATDKGKICLKQEGIGIDHYVAFNVQDAETIARWILEVKQEMEEMENSEDSEQD